MKLSCAFSCSLLAATALARLQVTVPNTHTEWQAGSPESIKWKSIDGSTSGRVSIELLEGADPSNLRTVSTIAENVPASSLQASWNVPKNLKSSKNYAIKIVDDSGEEYYGQFFKGTNANSGEAAPRDDRKPQKLTKPEATVNPKPHEVQEHNAQTQATQRASKPMRSGPAESSVPESKAARKDTERINSANPRTSTGVAVAAVAAVALGMAAF